MTKNTGILTAIAFSLFVWVILAYAITVGKQTKCEESFSRNTCFLTLK